MSTLPLFVCSYTLSGPRTPGHVDPRPELEIPLFKQNQCNLQRYDFVPRLVEKLHVLIKNETCLLKVVLVVGRGGFAQETVDTS